MIQFKFKTEIAEFLQKRKERINYIGNNGDV